MRQREQQQGKMHQVGRAALVLSLAGGVACAAGDPAPPRVGDAGSSEASASIEGGAGEQDPLAVGASQQLASGEIGITDVAVLGDAITFGTAQPEERRGKIARLTRGLAGAAPKTLVAGQDVLTLAVNPARVFWLNGTTSPVISQYLESTGTHQRFVPAPGTALPENVTLSGVDMRADNTDVYYFGWNLVRVPIMNPVPVPVGGGPNTTVYALTEDEIFVTGCRSGASWIIEMAKASGDRSMTNAACLSAMAATRDLLVIAEFGGGLRAAQVFGAPRPLGEWRALAAIETTRIALVPPFVVAATKQGALVRVPLAGGAATTLVADGVNPSTRLAADSNSVYWISADATALSRTRIK